MPSTDQIAQMSHFAIAWSIVATLVVFNVPLWICGLVVLGWALPKEFIFDLIVEQDTISDSLEDFTWYMIGGLASCLFFWILK